MDQQPYSVSAEFYDILQSETDRRRAERLYAPAARAAKYGILDLGAGTGIVTTVLLECSAAPVHAVEPAAAMRASLLTRLSGLSADQRARLTLYPDPLTAKSLEQVADLAICANIVGCLDPAERRATWRALASALVPGGLLLVDPPPAEVPAEPSNHTLPPVRVGPDTYTAEVRSSPDRGRLQVTYTYRVAREGTRVREVQESFRMWPITSAALHEELRDAGLIPEADGIAVPAEDLISARTPL